jgi:hypothetical protein
VQLWDILHVGQHRPTGAISRGNIAADGAARPPKSGHSRRAYKREQQQMVSDPEEQDVVPILPSAAASLREEDPRVASGPVVHHDSVQLLVRGRRPVVLVPDGGLKPLPACVADGDVGEVIVVVVPDQGVREEFPERVFWLGAENVVTQSSSAAISGPSWVVEKGV